MCHHRVHPGRDSERISGEKPGGGEDYSRRTGKLLQKRTRRWRRYYTNVINLVEVSICSLAEVDQKTAYQAFMF